MRHYLIGERKVKQADSENLALFGEPKTFSIASPDELRLISDISRVHEYTVRECLNGNLHARLDCHPGYSYGPLSFVDLVNGKAVSVDFRFYLTANSLLLVTRNENELLDQFIEKVSDEVYLEKYDTLTPQTLLIALMEEIIISNAAHTDTVEDSIEELEEKVLNEAKREYSKTIAEKRRLVMRMKHHIEPMLYVIQAFADNDNALFSEAEVRSIKILANKAQGTVSNILMLSDYVTHVREAYQAEHDIKSNDIMRVFTVVASIFLPPTLIVGWYGMNFDTMPELNWQFGYLYVIILNTLVIGGAIYLIKTKKWI